ncbi:MAG TPA: HD domain-containing protein [Polyangiaceae bacterium]|nr:HD domain-containing protein [Polyangiaceae bacterium]
MKPDRANAHEILTRRGMLEKSACAVVAVTATPWLSGCASHADAPALNDEPARGSDALRAADLPKRVANIRIPDTRLARAAADLALSVSPVNLYNHCMRTYLFAALVYKARRVRFDEELTFVAAALHDLGLVEAFMTPNERFEVDGADAALAFMKERRVPAARAEIVWDAIALHTAVGIATRKAPEIAAISIGAGMDATGMGLDGVSAEDVAEVIAAYPRLGFSKSAVETIIRYCEKKPSTLLLHPWESVARRHVPNLPLPFLEDVILAAPFPE